MRRNIHAFNSKVNTNSKNHKDFIDINHVVNIDILIHINVEPYFYMVNIVNLIYGTIMNVVVNHPDDDKPSISVHLEPFQPILVS